MMMQGCMFPKPVRPIPQINDGPVTVEEQVVLMLPGMGDDAEDMMYFAETGVATAGFQAAAWIGVDAHIGYYRDGLILQAFVEDVLSRYPARERVLLGLSLGGFGALLLAEAEPDAYEELILIAPFLGRKAWVDRVRDSGLQERPDDGPRERALLRIWRFLLERPHPDLPITVLIGDRDRLKPAVDLLRERAPWIEVYERPGKHRWSTWRELWLEYLSYRCPRDFRISGPQRPFYPRP